MKLKLVIPIILGCFILNSSCKAQRKSNSVDKKVSAKSESKPNLIVIHTDEHNFSSVLCEFSANKYFHEEKTFF